MDSDLATDSLEGCTKGLSISSLHFPAGFLMRSWGLMLAAKNGSHPMPWTVLLGKLKSIVEGCSCMAKYSIHQYMPLFSFKYIIQRALHPKKIFENILA